MGPKRSGALQVTRGRSPSGARAPPGSQTAAVRGYSPGPPPGSVAAVPFAGGQSFVGDAPFGTSLVFAPGKSMPGQESFGSVPYGSMAFTSPRNMQGAGPFGSMAGSGSMALAPGQSAALGSVPYGSMAFSSPRNVQSAGSFGSMAGSMAFAPGQSVPLGTAHPSVPFMSMALAPKQSFPLSDSYGSGYNPSDPYSGSWGQTHSSPSHAMQSMAAAGSARSRIPTSPGTVPQRVSGPGADTTPRMSLSPRATERSPSGAPQESFQLMSVPPQMGANANGAMPESFQPMSAPAAHQVLVATARAAATGAAPDPQSVQILSAPAGAHSSQMRGRSPSGSSSVRSGPQVMLPLAVSPTSQGANPNPSVPSPSVGRPSDPGALTGPGSQRATPPARAMSPLGRAPSPVASGVAAAGSVRSSSPALAGRPSLPPRGQARSRSAGTSHSRAPFPPQLSGGQAGAAGLLPPAISLTMPTDANRHMALPILHPGAASSHTGLPPQYSAPLQQFSHPMQMPGMAFGPPSPSMGSHAGLPIQGSFGLPPGSVVAMSLPMQQSPAIAMQMSAVAGGPFKPRSRRSKQASGASSFGCSRRSLSAPAESRGTGGRPLSAPQAMPPQSSVPPGLGSPPPFNVYPSYAVASGPIPETPQRPTNPAKARSPSPLINPSSDGVALAPPELALGSLVLPEAHVSPRKICICRERIMVVDRTGLPSQVADRPSVCVFCGNLKRSTTTPFCDACAVQRGSHVVRSHVFAAGTGAHASVEFPQNGQTESDPPESSSRQPPPSSLSHTLSDAFESNVMETDPVEVSPEALQAARDHVLGTNPWSLIDLLFTRLEQRWDVWNLETITFADIVSREKEHALVRAPDDAYEMCDVCHAKKGDWCCPPITLPIECDKQRWACDHCHEQGFKCHRGFLGGDKRYYNMILLQKFFKEADKDGSGFLDFLEWLYLTIHIARHVFGSYDRSRAPYLKLIRETYIQYSSEETMTYEQLMALVEEQLQPLPYNIEWRQLWDKYSQGRDELEYHSFLWLMYHAARPDSPHVNRLERKPSRALPRVNTIRRKPEKDAKPITNFDPSKNRKIKLLGQGGMSAAWLMDYDGDQVVGKIPLPSMDRKGIMEMLEGARKQQKLRHRNILAVLGVADCVKPPIILLEVAAGGDLSDWYGKKVDPVLQWKVCKEVAEALSYLHTSNPPMLHRDLKGANVFLTKGQTAKLADFDMLVDLGPPRYSASGICGTPGFMAPEVIAGGRYDTRVDIYSFASLLYEVTHGAFPFSKELENEPMEGPQSWFDATSRLTKAGVRPALDPKLVSSGVAQLITECWSSSPDARPSMALVVQRLSALSPDVDAETM